MEKSLLPTDFADLFLRNPEEVKDMVEEEWEWEEDEEDEEEEEDWEEEG